MLMLQQMVIFFIMVAVGWVVRRVGIFTPDSQPKFSALVANVTGPCLIVSSALSTSERMDVQALVNIYTVFVVLIVAMLAIGTLLPVLLRVPKRQRGVVNMLYWMTNIGFLGMPLMGGVYGEESMIYITLFLIINNALLYTYGIWCVAGAGGAEEPGADGGGEGSEGGGWRSRLRMLVNPGVAACVITFIVYFGGIELPYVITRSVTLIGALTAPLAMMLVGSSLFDVDIKHMFADLRLWAFTLLSMLVLPIVLVLALKPFVADATLLAACMVILATPSGVMTSVFANIYNREAYLLASEAVALTTLVSVVTLPLVSLATGV